MIEYAHDVSEETEFNMSCMYVNDIVVSMI